MEIEGQHRPQQFQRIVGFIQESPHRRKLLARQRNRFLNRREQGIGVGRIEWVNPVKRYLVWPRGPCEISRSRTLSFSVSICCIHNANWYARHRSSGPVGRPPWSSLQGSRGACRPLTRAPPANVSQCRSPACLATPLERV